MLVREKITVTSVYSYKPDLLTPLWSLTPISYVSYAEMQGLREEDFDFTGT